MSLRILSLYVILLGGFVASCGGINEDLSAPADITKTIVHYNIVLVPDLSNRLGHTTGLPDAEVVRVVIGNIPKIARYRRFTDQKDRFSVLLTSQQLGPLYGVDFSKLRIDLGRFPSQRDRIDYMTGSAPSRTLQSDTAAFLAEFQSIEAKVLLQRPAGADLWSLFHIGISSIQLLKEDSGHNGGSIRHVFRNILVVLTDGYIEAGVYGPAGCTGNQCRYLSKDRIDAFRLAFAQRTDKTEDMEAFFSRNRYGIAVAGNPVLQDVEVLLLQAEDRSLTTAGNATVNPSDFEIMKLFWQDWMKKSGVQHFDIRPLARDRHECERSLFTFLGIPQS